MSYFSKKLLFDENPVLDFVIFQDGVKLLFNCIVFVGGAANFYKRLFTRFFKEKISYKNES